MLLANMWGAMGSIAGALLAFRVTAAVFPPSPGAGLGGVSGPSRDVLARITAAVTATYVGGSINFFQVARMVRLAEGPGGSAMLGAVAGVDIFLMAIYFTFLVRVSCLVLAFVCDFDLAEGGHSN